MLTNVGISETEYPSRDVMYPYNDTYCRLHILMYAYTQEDIPKY